MLATRPARAATPASVDQADARARPIDLSRLGLTGARPIVADLAIVVTLTVAAFAIRYPYLWTAPRFRDETFNALRALDIYRGLYHAYTDVELYMGSFFNYAVVAAFYVFGPTIYVPRLVVTLFGVAMVGATYLLGRELGGRIVGIIAAAFLLTNGVLIAAMGHIGFSANIAPFFSTVGFWLLHRAVVRNRPWSMAGAGFFFGMGLHTHPIIVGFLPGAFLWLLWRGRDWFRTPWPYAAALLFLVAYSPMIAYNVQTAGGSVRHALYTAYERPDYVPVGRSATLTPATYLDRQGDYWSMSYRTLGGALDSRRGPADYLLDPALLATVALALAGVVYAARRGYSLPIWVIVPFSIILPIFNATHYDVEGDGRYFAPALPMIYACIGLLVVEGAGALQRRRRTPLAARAVALAAVALTLALVLAQIPPLARFYARSSRVEPTNQSLIAAMDDLKAARRGEAILLDDNLNDRKVENASPWDEASTFRIFKFIMEFDALPYQVAEVDAAALAAWTARRQPFILVVSSGQTGKDTAELNRLIEQHNLRDLNNRPARAPRPNDRYGIFRYTPPT